MSVRTIRYYIAEGLLPPPVGTGPRSAYTAGHLDRLRLIARLKAAYLPLKEIRRRLAGLDDEEVRRLLESSTAAPPETDSASAYLDRVLVPRHQRAESPPPPAAPHLPAPLHVQGIDDAPLLPADELAAGTPRFAAMADPFRPVPPPSEPTAPAPILGRAYPASLPADPEPDEAADPVPGAHHEAWRRISLGDDAELLIRESAYCRRHDRIDWLVRWARKVFG